MKYLVWSEEHGAWWRANKYGYTREILEAGMYSEEDAREIIKEAHKHTTALREIMIPDPFCRESKISNQENKGGE